MTIYKRTKTSYVRNTPNGKWKEKSIEVDYCGEAWVKKMTSDDVRIFNAMHWSRGGRVRYSDDYYFTNINPDRLHKAYDRFEPVRIPREAIGRREAEALAYADQHMRCTESGIENGHEILVIPYLGDDGDERTVTYDLTHKKFVN